MFKWIMAALAATVLSVVAVGCGDTSTPDAAEAKSAPAKAEATEAEEQEPSEDAGDFLKEVVSQRMLDQWGRAWETLHPLHQEVVSRSEYSNCMSNGEPMPGEFEIEEVDEYDEPSVIPGQTTEVPSKAVTLRLSAEDEQFTKTAHALAVDGEWRWMLDDEYYEAFKAGECPDA